MLNELPMITVPEMEVKDIVPIWLALKPRMEDLRLTLSLAEIFSNLELLEKKEEVFFEETIYAKDKDEDVPVDMIRWSNKDDVLDLFRYGRLNEMHRQELGKELFEKWGRFFRRIARHVENPEFYDHKVTVKKEFMPMIEKYIGSISRLKQLVEMEKKLEGMCS